MVCRTARLHGYSARLLVVEEANDFYSPQLTSQYFPSDFVLASLEVVEILAVPAMSGGGVVGVAIGHGG